MRDFRFRAWHKKNKEMFHPFNIDCLGWRTSVAQYFDGSGVTTDIELMQYIGLDDKEGKPIYEGDVVKTKYQKKAEVVYQEENACFALRTIDEIVKDEFMYSFNDDVEILGNIYQNPELLEESNIN